MGVGARDNGFAGLNRLTQGIQYGALEFRYLGANTPRYS